MEWVVGQWVEAWGRIWRIIETEKTRSKLDGNVEPSWWCNHGEMKPFQWQVGKTYRTTMDGVTATIANVSGGVVFADACRSRRMFCTKTGVDIDLSGKPSGSDASLLPFLADEPSEPAATEPTLSERFTVEQYGDRWRVRDNQTGLVAAAFPSKRVTEAALMSMKCGDMSWMWSLADELVATAQPSQTCYHRTIKGVVIDVYDILIKYGITCPAQAHAIKKLLMPGERGAKTRDQDLAEAIVSIERARELAKGGAE